MWADSATADVAVRSAATWLVVGATVVPAARVRRRLGRHGEARGRSVVAIAPVTTRVASLLRLFMSFLPFQVEVELALPR